MTNCTLYSPEMQDSVFFVQSPTTALLARKHNQIQNAEASVSFVYFWLTWKVNALFEGDVSSTYYFPESSFVVGGLAERRCLKNIRQY